MLEPETEPGLADHAPDLPGTAFAVLYGTFTPHPWHDPDRDPYIVFHDRAKSMGWLDDTGIRITGTEQHQTGAPGLWRMNDAGLLHPSTPATATPASATPATATPATVTPASVTPTTAAPTADAPTNTAPAMTAPPADVVTTSAPITDVSTISASTTGVSSTSASSTSASTTGASTPGTPAVSAPATSAPSTSAPAGGAPTTSTSTTNASTTCTPASGKPGGAFGEGGFPEAVAWFQVEVVPVRVGEGLPVQPFVRCAVDSLQRIGALRLRAVQVLLPVGLLSGLRWPPSVATAGWLGDAAPGARVPVRITVDGGQDRGLGAVEGKFLDALARANQEVFRLGDGVGRGEGVGGVPAPPVHDSFWDGPSRHRVVLSGSLSEWSAESVGWVAGFLAELGAQLGVEGSLVITVEERSADLGGGRLRW